MNKYVVKVINVFANYIEVDAETEDKAKEIAKNRLSTEDITQSFKHYYEATIPPEHWGIISKEEFDILQAQELATLAEQKNQ